MVLLYYLALLMLKYGLDKIFKTQFYLPEPNILYTPMGLLDRDILFWSVMGTSHTYNIFMGLMEVIPACMLLYRKTRILGLLILLGVMINIVCVNIGFDISVKLFSSFLVLTNLILLIPSFKKIIQFFVFNKAVTLPNITGKKIIKSKVVRISLKTVLILFLFAESLLPYVKSGKYNDDNVARNYLHGAYEVSSIKAESKNEIIEGMNIKRFFIHRQNYFIFQYEDDSMEDFRLEIEPTQNEFVLTNYNGDVIMLKYKYSETTKKLELTSKELGWVINSKTLPWRELPLMQPLFHWTVDGI